MHRKWKKCSIHKVGILMLTFFGMWACAKVPITERRQLSLIPNEQVLSLSFDQYRQFLDQHKVIKGTPEAEMAERVGQKIRGAVEIYLKENRQENLLEGYEWEFNLVADDKINAFAMPGGKVVVFTGILKVTQDESGLATVLGHEIAHAIARHGNERMSQGLAAQLGGAALGLALSNKPEQTRQLFMAAYGVGAQVGILLPYSRLHESEADKMGLIFMTMAGYDPHHAVDFWQRMEKQSEPGGAPPEFLSTHPSHEKRIEDLQAFLPTALRYYRK